MKFGRALREEENAAPQHFKGSFFDYKRAKQLLKHCLHNRDQDKGLEDSVKTDKIFLTMLFMQLKEVDRHFERELQKVTSSYDLLTKCKGFMSLCTSIGCSIDVLGIKGPLEVAKQAQWCIKYAELNFQALRKIAKKRDRLFGGRVGAEFVQACFRGEVSARTFISSFVLIELAAVERILLTRTQPGSCDKADSSSWSATLEEKGSNDSEHSCSICLLLVHPEVFTSDRGCPCCRTSLYGSRDDKRSPFSGIRQMRCLQSFLMQRYPQDCQRRKEEDAEYQAALKAELPTAWETIRHAVNGVLKK